MGSNPTLSAISSINRPEGSLGRSNRLNKPSGRLLPCAGSNPNFFQPGVRESPPAWYFSGAPSAAPFQPFSFSYPALFDAFRIDSLFLPRVYPSGIIFLKPEYLPGSSLVIIAPLQAPVLLPE